MAGYGASADALVISQVYGGGGNSGASYTNDFIELFNDSAAAFDLDGLSVQYASAAGASWQATVLSGLLAPYGYYLIAEDTGSAGDGALLPTPDVTGDINLSAANGKVALSDGTDPFTTDCPGASVLDLVGYGTANCFEGTAATGGLSSTVAALRLAGGLTDSNDNVSDFALLTPSPRNSASPQNLPADNDLEDTDAEPLPEPPAGLLALTALIVLLWQRRGE
jgi:predicted extracellular nuclease